MVSLDSLTPCMTTLWGLGEGALGTLWFSPRFPSIGDHGQVNIDNPLHPSSIGTLLLMPFPAKPILVFKPFVRTCS